MEAPEQDRLINNSHTSHFPMLSSMLLPPMLSGIQTQNPGSSLISLSCSILTPSAFTKFPLTTPLMCAFHFYFYLLLLPLPFFVQSPSHSSGLSRHGYTFTKTSWRVLRLWLLPPPVVWATTSRLLQWPFPGATQNSACARGPQQCGNQAAPPILFFTFALP